jgi:hypothetical protein
VATLTGDNSAWDKENRIPNASYFDDGRLESSIYERSYPTDSDIFNQKWSNSFVAKSQTKQNAIAIASFDPTRRSTKEYEMVLSKVSC